MLRSIPIGERARAGILGEGRLAHRVERRGRDAAARADSIAVRAGLTRHPRQFRAAGIRHAGGLGADHAGRTAPRGRGAEIEEVRVTASRDRVALEVAVDHRQDQALQGGVGRAGDGVRLLHVRAHEAGFRRARLRAAVVVVLVAVVAHLAVVDVAVTASGAARLRDARRVAANGLRGAGLRATGSVSVEQPVLGALVAGLPDLDHPIAAHGFQCRPRRCTTSRAPSGRCWSSRRR